MNIYHELLNFLPLERIKKDEPLKKYTFTKTGGNADLLVFPNNYQEIQDIVRFANENNIDFTILGNGSNIIIRDGGIRGIVISLLNLNNISLNGSNIVAQSGATIIETSRFALSNKLTGLEFACGIPGTVGGAVFMNAGAYGGEVSNVIKEAVVLTKEGEFLTLNNQQLNLSYRHSSVADNGYLVLEATFELTSGEYDVIKEKMDELTFLRESKQPLEYPSCGSVFKRPPGHFAGKLIQDCGLQGTRVGGVEVSKKHAGFMVNVDNGTATDYMNLISLVQKTVMETFGIELETEVKVIGEDLVKIC